MTRNEALTLARAKWPNAALHLTEQPNCPTPQLRCLIYESTYQPEGEGIMWLGTGDSWESACRAAGLLPEEGR